MEPFDITFHEVTSLEQEDSDAFGNVVNYDLSFSQSDQSLPLSAYNVNTIQYTWKDNNTTPRTTSAIQTTNGGVPTGRGRTVQHLSVWQDGSRSGQPHLSFLVHPDDHLGQGQSVKPPSPSLTRADLKTLAQITSNTTAVSRESRREGQKILVARTRTSPSTPIPPPWKANMSHSQQGTPTPAPYGGQGISHVPTRSVVAIDTISYVSASVDDDGDAPVEDNSFETVAEALKLQESVIGNKSLTPAPPDVVAQIIAEAERKLKTGGSSPLSITSTPRESPIPISGLVQPAMIPTMTPFSLPPMMSSPPPMMPSLPQMTSSPPPMMPSLPQMPSSPPPLVTRQGGTPPQPQHLTRIIPTEITVEKRAQSGSIISQSRHPSSPPNAPLNSNNNNHTTTPQPSVVSSVIPDRDNLIQPQVLKLTPSSPTVSLSVVDYLQNNAASLAEPLQQQMAGSRTQTNVQKTSKPSSSSSTQVDVMDTISEASYSSELELESYTGLQPGLIPTSSYELESEEFLRSLPPIKPINLDDYTTSPVVLPPPYVPDSKTRSQKKTAAKEKTGPISTNSPAQQTESPSTHNLHTTPNLEHTSNQRYESPSQVTATSGHQSAVVKVSPASFGTSMSTREQGHATPGVRSSNTIDRKQYEKLLKEKAKLQGQLEILNSESHNMLQERSELQSQLSALQAKMAVMSAGEDSGGLNAKGLHKEVLNLRESRQLLEQTILDANRMLSEKAEEVRTLQDELQSVQEQTTKFQVRVQELRDEIRAKDMNTQALKNKIAELYVEVQTSIQSKMDAETEARTARNDLLTLVKAKEWYQEQLQLAHDVRSKLQREITVLQAQATSHGTIVERLKTESGRLRQQLSDVQQKALRDKEVLARHLEGIQNDMMEREAAFLEIQRERKLYEDTFNTQVVTAEEEKSRLTALQQATSELEGQLDRAHGEAKKRHEQLLSVENSQMDAMKKLTLAGENLTEKDKLMEEMEQKLIQMENQLQAIISDLTKKDSEIMSLKEERACTEIALKSALQEKASVDKALEVLKGDMGKVEQSFKQMKQELSNRLVELERAQAEKVKLQEELDRSQHELDIKSRSVDSMTRTFEGQSAAQKEMASEKGKLQLEKEELRRKVIELESALSDKEKNILEESAKVQNLMASVVKLETEQEETKNSVPLDKVQAYETEISGLRDQLKAVEDKEKDGVAKAEGERDQLKKDMERLKDELTERQRKYEENIAALDGKLVEVNANKQQLETELGIAKRSQELSEMEERETFAEEIQALTLEVANEKKQKHDVEARLKILQAQKANEIENLKSSLEYQTQALEAIQTHVTSLAETEETNQRLVLELEMEKGKVLGLSQKNQELKEHSHQLEGALANRESCLEELRRTVEESQQGLEERESKFKSRIASLEVAVEKEVSVQRDIRKQMGVKIMENKRLKKQQESLKVETDQLKQDLSTSHQVASQAGAELELANQKAQALQKEVAENASLHRTTDAELERVKRELTENMARYPVLQEQIQSLEWQLCQKGRELESAMEHVKLVEVRGQEEVEAIKATLSEKMSEIDALQTELSVLRQEKTQQRSQVSELRGALKASVQHHKLTQRLNENDVMDKGTQANIEKKVVIPPLPFELTTIEKLLQDTRVTPLESKPLDQLSSCLTSLRAEITGLQKHMDLHTNAVTVSSQSAKNVEDTVNDLNEVMRTIANTIIAANSTKTITMATAMDREPGEIINV